MLVHAGVLQSQTLTQVLEEALATVKPLGQVLLDWHLLTPTLLDIALRLQVLLEQGRIRSRRAIKALSIAFGNGCSLNEALASIADPPGTGVDISLAFFLKHTGLFAPWLGELDSIDQSGLENKDQLQFLSAFVETQKLAPAIRCAFLLRNGLLSFEEALLAYHCSLLSGQDIGDFLADIGWVEAATMQAVAHRRAELTVVPGQTAA